MKEISLDVFVKAKADKRRVEIKVIGADGTAEILNVIPLDYGPYNGSSSPEDIRYQFIDNDNLLVIKPRDVLNISPLTSSFDSTAVIYSEHKHYLEGNT